MNEPAQLMDDLETILRHLGQLPKEVLLRNRTLNLTVSFSSSGNAYLEITKALFSRSELKKRVSVFATEESFCDLVIKVPQTP